VAISAGFSQCANCPCDGYVLCNWCMKLQYLGDARDAFKWDLLHWICTRSSPAFSELVFVPLLTRDIQGSNEGRVPHHYFQCQDFLRPFVASLVEEPRSLMRIAGLGSVQPRSFKVTVFSPERFLHSGTKRREYWAEFDPTKMKNAVVFFDPDNGYETRTCNGQKWIRHSELEDLFTRLPETSIAAVYQHRPRLRRWPDVFVGLQKKLTYIDTAVAVHEANLAFVGMAGNAEAGRRISSAIDAYAERNSAVNVTRLCAR
jgi:hypothetical protein